ncbi:hypothetical protein SteCoe_21886 [Stentor coeruleus]|uniref:Uncharacterized protein n=1 Tax=Stentor coeruleus TaxID=5963 RepID=A0A1R2BNI1_9CILI|nr:hypothetical protein SteCoe_21886 [Stentor coeruleus]
MDDAEYKALVLQFTHDLGMEDSKYDRKNLKRSEPASLTYFCPCQICSLESKDKFSARIALQHHTQPDENKELRGFTWLLEKLGEISVENSYKLNIPDTAVFRKGKASFLIQFQRDRSIKFVNSGEKLTNQEIIKNVTNIVRNRKKEENLYKAGKLRPSAVGIVEYGKETACIRFMNRHRDNDLEDVFSEDEEGAIRVMNENEFTGLMWQRPGSAFWKTIAYIQSALKCKKGIGESFMHTYIFNNRNNVDIIKSGLEDQEENEEAFYIENRSKYCEYIFKKIYYLFEKHLNLMLIQIKGEFVRDDNNRIWLIHASDIITEAIPVPENVGTPENKPPPLKIDEDQLLNHLAQVAKQPKNHRTEKFSKLMNKECEKMIDASKIMDIFKPAEPDLLSTSAFAKLRRFTPYNLEELLDRDKAKTLLKVYTDNRKHKKNASNDIKGIDYDSHAPTPISVSPYKVSHSWVFTPKIRNNTGGSRSRPMSSKLRHSYNKSFIL